MVSLEKKSEKIKKINQLREELYTLLNVYGLDHLEVLEFSRKLDALILEFL
ncbi:MAG: aspartyl-phosphate phosphatase Spo0E family protein [Ruminiclostridium sp.]|nr:aspartyl-phosphate phosphatase Spo0E family protein [Ruminiclostridium sp.]